MAPWEKWFSRFEIMVSINQAVYFAYCWHGCIFVVICNNNGFTLLFFSTWDGRMDSPGHCAQYCTYTFMENDTKKIVSIITLDKREAGGKSGNLEKLGFIKSMTILGEKEVPVELRVRLWPCIRS